MEELKLEKGQKLVFLNVRSLYTHLNELQVEFNDTAFCMLGFTESWLNENIPNSLIPIKGYSVVRLDRQVNKRGGGVIIYIRNDLSWSYIDKLSLVSDSDIEALTIIIKRKYQKKLCVTLVYLPPAGNVSSGIKRLSEIGEIVDKTGATWIIGGDVNINYNDKKSLGMKNITNQLINKLSLTQLITKHTRTTDSTSSLIDHIYTNDIYEVKESGVITYGLSDHYVTYTILKRNLDKEPKISFSCRTMKGYSIDKLHEILEDISWNDFFLLQDVNESWNYIYVSYLKALDKIAPIIQVKNCKPKSDWVSPELLAQIRERDKLKTNADSLNNNEHYKNFKLARKRVKNMIFRAKKDYIQQRINDAKNDSKRYWAELGKILPSKKNVNKSITQIVELIDNTGNIIPDTETADYINDYFVTIGPNLATKITLDNHNYKEQCRKLTFNAMTNWRVINEEEVELAINDINVGKSSII